MINKAQQIIISAGQIHESERLYIYMYVCVRVRVCQEYHFYLYIHLFYYCIQGLFWGCGIFVCLIICEKSKLMFSGDETQSTKVCRYIPLNEQPWYKLQQHYQHNCKQNNRIQVRGHEVKSNTAYSIHSLKFRFIVACVK